MLADSMNEDKNSSFLDELLKLRSYVEKLEAINKSLSNQLGAGASPDCTNHSMYIKAQALIEEKIEKIADLERRIEQLNDIVFKKANELEAIPELFSIQKNSEKENELYTERIAPIKAIGILRDCMAKGAAMIEIGVRVLEKND